MAVVHLLVHCRHAHRPALKDLVPFPERLDARHQQAIVLVAEADQLQKDLGFQLTAPHVGDVIDHQRL